MYKLLFILSFLFLQAMTFKKENYNFEGNKQTNASYLLELLENCSNNDRLNDLAEVKQCIFNSMLFSEVKVKRKGKLIVVTVQERFYIIPVPMVSFTGEAWSVGLAVADMNLFGNGEILAIGGGYGSRGALLLVNYAVPRAFGTNWYYNVSSYNNSSDYFLYGDKAKVLYSYSSMYNNVSLLGGYSFDRNKKISSGFYGAWVQYNELDNYAVPESNNYLSYIGSIVWGIKEFKLYYSEGWSVSYNLRAQLIRTDGIENARLHNTGANYTKTLTERFVLGVGVKFARVFGGTFADALTVGGTSGYRGIPFAGVWTDYAAAGYLESMYLLKDYKYLSLVTGPFFDTGYVEYDPDVKDNTVFYSYGISFAAYLKKIYLPGFGINIGSNNPINPLFIHLFVGLPF